MACLGFATYASSLRVGFLYDDHLLIESNPAIRHWSLATLRHDFCTGFFNDPHDTDFYRPLLSVTHRLEYTLWGLNPVGYHLTNILLHIGNALLLMALVLALGFNASVALIVGCLFVVHPIGVEQMLIITARTELMALLFSLASILLLIKEGVTNALLGIGCFILALLSKESAVMTPFLLALVFSMRKAPPRYYARVLVLLLLLPFYFILRTHVLGGLALSLSWRWVFPFFWKAFPKAVFLYAGHILLPWQLHTERPFPPLGVFWPLYTASAIVLMIFLIWKRSRIGLFCVAWFILELLPKTPLMLSNSLLSDHWCYPAMLGVLLPVSWVFDQAVHATRPLLRWLAVGLLGFFILISAVLVQRNIALRGSDEGLYRDALRYNHAPAIEHNLALLLLAQGRFAEAIPYLTALCRDLPDDATSVNTLAWAYWKNGQRAQALGVLEAFLKTHPAEPSTRETLQRLQRPARPSR